jgi:hypothetical protein
VDARLAVAVVDETTGGGMAFREVRVFEVREVLRLWLRGEGQRRYDLNLWIGHLFEGAAYLPR